MHLNIGNEHHANPRGEYGMVADETRVNAPVYAHDATLPRSGVGTRGTQNHELGREAQDNEFWHLQVINEKSSQSIMKS